MKYMRRPFPTRTESILSNAVMPGKRKAQGLRRCHRDVRGPTLSWFYLRGDVEGGSEESDERELGRGPDWNEWPADDVQWSLLAALTLLTAQRPGEVRSMKWADVDLEAGWWSIPAAVAKNGRPHRVPLTATAIEILEERLKNAGEEPTFVFENRPGSGSVTHRGKKAASILCKSLTFHFRAHDLRRTAATRMAEAGVSRDHIAKVLNHVEAGPAATRVYDRYDYDAEKREALERWARRLQAILEGKTKRSSRFERNEPDDGIIDRELLMTAREDLIARIQRAAPDLRNDAVRELWLFGSAAREEMQAASDVDILVDFSRPVSLFEFVRLRWKLESLLERPVDLVTRDALKPQLRDQILREAVRAA